MRLSEIAILVVVTLLTTFGFGFAYKGPETRVLGIVMISVGFLISICYVYIVKIRPLGAVRKFYREALLENEFELEPLGDKPYRKAVVRLLKSFPNFADYYLEVDELHSRQHESSLIIAGAYVTSGAGMHFGYFLVGAVNLPEHVELDLKKYSESNMSFKDELALGSLPAAAQATLQAFPYDFQFDGNMFLVDFDTRNIRADNFRDSFDRMIAAIDRIGDQ